MFLKRCAKTVGKGVVGFNFIIHYKNHCSCRGIRLVNTYELTGKIYCENTRNYIRGALAN